MWSRGSEKLHEHVLLTKVGFDLICGISVLTGGQVG